MTRRIAVGRAIGVLLGLLACAPARTAQGEQRTPRGPAKVLKVLDSIGQSVRSTRYEHVTRIVPSKGIYHVDCSGLADWVLKRAVPSAHRTVARPEGRRPVAADFARRIARLEPGQTRGPWHRVADVTQAAPGDVIAWVRPPWFPSKNTGHVAFVVSAPEANPGPVPGYLLRVVDSSRYPHEDDTRGQGLTGVGEGTMLLATDGQGIPTGYGWYGSQSEPDWIVPTEIVIGRPLR